MKKIAMPKWMMQGLFYGIFLAILGFLAGGVAVTAAPGLFPAASNIVAGALGFVASLGIAYTRDISQDKETAMPKWMMQGLLYGMFLGILGFFTGGIAVTAAPGMFPVGTQIATGALGFLAAVGIAYTNDINSQPEEPEPDKTT